MERLSFHRQQQHRDQELRHVFKVMACGCMIGTGILFPLANVEGFQFRALTLSIFIISALGFHALYLQPFIRFGPFTAAAALFFLLVAVVGAGSSRTDLIPWLPLFIASLSLITVAIYEISQHVGPAPLSFTAGEPLSGISIDTLSERSSRTMSTQRGVQTSLESNRNDSLLFAHHGPPSRTSHRTATDITDITLSIVEGYCRPEWDPQTRSYFLGNALPEREPLGKSCQRSPSPGRQENRDLDMDLDSDPGSLESSHPLLGPQGGRMP
ncbi:hypothetical protein N657DRAFT_80941 [Parathielavia appendiculata]|uniref:Uncharacterized protein n=1 Tax=Parathielavia appendiculata TaxID=2587402 RepID=A0AAN6UDD2_9PEZI|nr:hypothetical protein N657DRAFT_80941 [Parathielavia appendiculata]